MRLKFKLEPEPEPEPGKCDGSGSSQILRIRAAPAPKPWQRQTVLGYIKGFLLTLFHGPCPCGAAWDPRVHDHDHVLAEAEPGTKQTEGGRNLET